MALAINHITPTPSGFQYWSFITWMNWSSHILGNFMFLAEVSPYGLAIESLRFDDGKGCKGLRLSSNVWSIYGVYMECGCLAAYP